MVSSACGCSTASATLIMLSPKNSILLGCVLIRTESCTYILYMYYLGTDAELSVTTAAGEGWSTAQRLCHLYYLRLASPQLALNQAQYMPPPRVSTGGYKCQEKDVVLEYKPIHTNY